MRARLALVGLLELTNQSAEVPITLNVNQLFLRLLKLHYINMKKILKIRYHNHHVFENTTRK